MKLTVSDLSNIINASTSNTPSSATAPHTLTSVLTDSRSLVSPSSTVFFALQSPTGDGHRYIAQLYAKGVRAFVVDSNREVSLPVDAAVLSVPDTLEALQKLGAHLRKSISGTVIAITGSRGKTVVKEMLNTVLGQDMTVSCAPRSWNSQVGVPLSLTFDNPRDSVHIFEAGISRPGEMDRLQNILKPQIGLFTGLTDEHGRQFESLESKCREKMLLFRNCSHVVFIDNQNGLIEKILREQCPDVIAHKVTDYKEMCLEAISLVHTPTDAEIYKLGTVQTVSARIDFTDTSEGVVLAYDHCSCDFGNVCVGLDMVRRRLAPQMDFTVILGDLECGEPFRHQHYSHLLKILPSYGVGKIIGVGSDAIRFLTDYSGPLTTVVCDNITELTRIISIYDLYNSTIYINGANRETMDDIHTWLTRHRNITRMEINLDSLKHNFMRYRALLPVSTGIIGMVKAAAYGCGAVEVARTLQDAGADMIAVAVVDEGVSLREGGVTLPVIVLDPWCENMRAIVDSNLEPTLIDHNPDVPALLELHALRAEKKHINVHVKLDTGMHRVGLCEDQLEAFATMLKRYPTIRVASTFSHLATADSPDMEDYTEFQLTTFDRMSDKLQKLLGYNIQRHILNTAGITRHGFDRQDSLARLGIGLYGLTPFTPESPEGLKDAEDLLPVAKLTTRIIAIRECKPGMTVGYGRKGKILRRSIIATLPIGYADGIDRRLGNGNASFYVNGHMCPTVGNICMDLCMIDVTDCPDLGNGSVEIIGPHAPIDRLAKTLGTINYEILSRISPRVKRVYFRE